MFQIIVKLIGLIMLLIGVILVYGFGDQNEASSGLKILGFILSILGATIIYFSL